MDNSQRQRRHRCTTHQVFLGRVQTRRQVKDPEDTHECFDSVLSIQGFSRQAHGHRRRRRDDDDDGDGPGPGKFKPRSK